MRVDNNSIPRSKQFPYGEIHISASTLEHVLNVKSESIDVSKAKVGSFIEERFEEAKENPGLYSDIAHMLRIVQHEREEWMSELSRILGENNRAVLEGCIGSVAQYLMIKYPLTSIENFEPRQKKTQPSPIFVDPYAALQHFTEQTSCSAERCLRGLKEELNSAMVFLGNQPYVWYEEVLKRASAMNIKPDSLQSINHTLVSEVHVGDPARRHVVIAKLATIAYSLTVADRRGTLQDTVALA